MNENMLSVARELCSKVQTKVLKLPSDLQSSIGKLASTTHAEIKDLRSNPQELLPRHGTKIGAAFLLANHSWLTAIRGFGGNNYEMMSGIMSYVALAFALKNKTFPIAVAISISSIVVQQYPNLVNHNPLAQQSIETLLFGDTPVMLEWFLQSPTEQLRKKLREAKLNIFTRSIANAAAPILFVFAKPRIPCVITGAAATVPLINNACNQHHFYLLPAYAFAIIADAFIFFSRPPAPRQSSKPLGANFA